MYVYLHQSESVWLACDAAGEPQKPPGRRPRTRKT